VRALVLTLLALVAASSPTVVRADRRTHVVVEGETLEQIAARYGATIESLRALNELGEDAPPVGQTLTVDAAEGLLYTVLPGDALSCIAARLGCAAEQIRADNPTIDFDHLQAGATIFLRGARPIGRVTVQDDETALRLAERVEVPIEELARVNPWVDFERLAPGTRLMLPSRRRLAHEVQRGDTFARLASRFGVSVAQLAEWNPGIDPERLQVGASLFIHRPTSLGSVGSPNCGAIEGGVQVPPHRGYVLRNPGRSWASPRSAERLVAAFDALVRAYPRARRVRVHDLSLQGGGPIDDHRSHQSGRDVDITYYQRRCDPVEGCPMRVLDPRALDVTRQWALLRHWLRRYDVDAIFLDYQLQEPLYREAQRRGATAEELERWFQYPRRGQSVGTIRHFPNHRDHFHVRFRCAPTEQDCQ
jgi:LysM repeat protein